jgi:hypothetical protein
MYVCFHVVEVFKLFMIIEESDLPPKTTSNVGPSQFDYDQTSSSFSLFFCEIIVRRNEELTNQESRRIQGPQGFEVINIDHIIICGNFMDSLTLSKDVLREKETPAYKVLR